jgi:aminoglycoside/choline kinase family phosphotransferase
MRPHRTTSRAAREAAETLAIQALAFIAEEPQAFSRFLQASGIAVEQIRAASREPGFLAGVLEHMLAEESLLIAFAQRAGIDPAEVALAASALGGRWDRDLP